jgi:hypothetical protein
MKGVARKRVRIDDSATADYSHTRLDAGSMTISTRNLPIMLLITQGTTEWPCSFQHRCHNAGLAEGIVVISIR